ncbi:hypothetical protein ACEE90_04185 [Corynebacterium phoceense]
MKELRQAVAASKEHDEISHEDLKKELRLLYKQLTSIQSMSSPSSAIAYTLSVRKELHTLAQHDQQRIISAIESLATQSRSWGVKTLHVVVVRLSQRQNVYAGF